jgi:hypothetical protein
MLALITRLKRHQLNYVKHQDQLIKALEDFNASIDDVNFRERIAIQINHSLMVKLRGEGLSSDPELGFTLNSVLYGSNNALIASKLASIYHALSFINSTETVVLRRDDLVDRYCGWSSVKTNGILKTHSNKLILIEEAHNLMMDKDDGCGEDVLHALSHFLYSSEETIIILSTDRKLQDTIFNYCPGLRRRFMWDFECMLLNRYEVEVKESDCE